MSDTILYIQYTNPGAYPPILHSSSMFVKRGFQVGMLGVETPATAELFPPDLKGRWSRNISSRSAWLRFVKFNWIVLYSAMHHDVRVVYGSDLMTCGALCLVKLFRPSLFLVYHEHDSPSAPFGFKGRVLVQMRRWILKRASLVVFPGKARVQEVLGKESNRKNIRVVLNCPSSLEVATDRSRQQQARINGLIEVYYHGTIVPNRLPLNVCKAIISDGRFRLNVAGYETLSSGGWLEEIMIYSQEKSLHEGFRYLGAHPRPQLTNLMKDMHVGLALVPRIPDDVNERTMAGPSNKPFDYLSSGLSVVCTDRAEWKDLFGREEQVFFCYPEEPKSVIEAIINARNATPFDPMDLLQGNGWTYEQQFSPVLDEIVSRL
jgi:hypothetical protein